jgi:glucoamylase
VRIIICRSPIRGEPTSGHGPSPLTARTAAGPYFLRITADGNANAGTKIQLSDGGPLIDQRAVVDPSYLELVRLGVLRPDDPRILDTLTVVDQQLGYATPNGPFWHRASFDGYGETNDGSEWQPTPTGSGLTHGRGWPLLTGERGEYQLAAGAQAQNNLDTMARSGDDQSFLLPEQVWDHQPPSGSGRLQPGEPTFSATPLAWTHAQFIRLAWSIDAGAPGRDTAIGRLPLPKPDLRTLTAIALEVLTLEEDGVRRQAARQ